VAAASKRVVLDTNAMVALLCSWHEHHQLVVRAGASVGGGRTYDALIAATAALLAPCDLLTLNAKHFAGADSPELTIVDLMRAP
jgi:hypothetical protein